MTTIDYSCESKKQGSQQRMFCARLLPTSIGLHWRSLASSRDLAGSWRGWLKPLELTCTIQKDK